MIQRITLDIDTTDKEFLNRMEFKIKKCPFLLSMDNRPSKSKGFHYILECSKKCDICRICYDDERRFFYDQFRPIRARNILFSRRVKM